MYSLSNRLRISLVFPIIFLIISAIRFATLQSNGKAIGATNLLTWPFAYLILQILFAYILSVLFLSVETLVKMYITDKENPENQNLKSQFEIAPWTKKLRLLEQRETSGYENQVTHSVIFQVALWIFAFFVVSSTTSIVGTIVTLTICLMILVDQGMMLYRTRQINSWFWQIQANITRDSQQAYYLLCVLVYLILLFMTFK